jgi:hypothetical protein
VNSPYRLKNAYKTDIFEEEFRNQHNLDYQPQTIQMMMLFLLFKILEKS